MKNLWAPWRMDYIRAPEKEKDCIFCKKIEMNNDQDGLLLYRGKNAFVMLNLYPYNNGHILIAPYEHVNRTNKLSADCLSEIMELADSSMNILTKEMNAQGFNFGANIGSAAGAGIEEHIHFHLVPRWVGDTNFMPILGHTKVQVQGLKETWTQLQPLFNKLKQG